MKKISAENLFLQGNVQRLRSEVDHSLSAYQTLAHRKSQTQLSAPEKYFENPLSTREFQIMQLVAKGMSNKEICDQIYISKNTLKTHLKRIYKKLDTHIREEAMAREYGLV